MSISELLFSFTGRVGRMSWWLTVLGVWLATVILCFVLMPLMGLQTMHKMSGAEQAQFKAEMEPMSTDMETGTESGADPSATSEPASPTAPAAPAPELGTTAMILASLPLVICIVVGLLFLWITLAVTAKRFHDRDKSGWWVLIQLVPLIGQVWVFVDCGCLRGTEGDNRFGGDPLARSGI